MIYLNMHVHISLGTVTILYQTVFKDTESDINSKFQLFFTNTY